MKTQRKNDSDEAQGGAGGGVSMHAEALHLEEARTITEIARRGGSITFIVPPTTCTVAIAIRLRGAGLIETQEQLDSTYRVRLTPFGSQRLADAAKLIAAAPMEQGR